MRESIFLNKSEMVSFYWVDVEIGRRGGAFLYTLCVRISVVMQKFQMTRRTTIGDQKNSISESADIRTGDIVGSAE
jgi:hypothetical protein